MGISFRVFEYRSLTEAFSAATADAVADRKHLHLSCSFKWLVSPSSLVSSLSIPQLAFPFQLLIPLSEAHIVPLY